MKKLCIHLLAMALIIVGSCSPDKDKVLETKEDPNAPKKEFVVDTTTPDNPLGNTKFYRAYYDDNVAVYCDLAEMPEDQKWVQQFLSDLWAHVKDLYQCTPDQRLYIFIIHNGGGGSPAYYYTDFFDHHNGFTCGPYANTLTHEMFHIVETVAFGAHSNSAGFPLWGDSEFAQIFQYDVLKWYGMSDEAEEIKNWALDIHVDFPKPNTYWSRDWFWPIYENYGGADVLVKFFKLIGEQFPANRNLTMGEFVHFFSGAAGVSLKPLATTAFGWPYEYEAEFNKAREDFPGITYKDPE